MSAKKDNGVNVLILVVGHDPAILKSFVENCPTERIYVTGGDYISPPGQWLQAVLPADHAIVELDSDVQIDFVAVEADIEQYNITLHLLLRLVWGVLILVDAANPDEVREMRSYMQHLHPTLSARAPKLLLSHGTFIRSDILTNHLSNSFDGTPIEHYTPYDRESTEQAVLRILYLILGELEGLRDERSAGGTE